MRKLVAALLIAALPVAAQAQQDFSKVEIKTQKITDGIFILQGAGGNIGLSTGADGPLVIDDQYAELAPKIVAAIKAQQDKPIAFIVNTHFHGDHTGGNAAFAALGARIVAQDNVRKRLKDGVVRPGSFNSAPVAAENFPVITFPESLTFWWNGDEISVWHSPPAHTDGDAIVEFKKANVVHMGDVFFNGFYPFIDVDSGGSIDGYIAAIETELKRVDDNTKIIPGHGPLGNKQDLEKFLGMLKDVRGRVAALIKRGVSEEDAIKADPLKDLNDAYGKFFITGDQMTRATYRSLKNSAPAKKK